MNGSEMRTIFDELVQDVSMSDTMFYVLVNSTKDMIEAEYYWSVLESIDSSNTMPSGVGTISLPTRFLSLQKAYVGTREYIALPQNQNRLEKAGSYSLDIANSNIRFAPIAQDAGLVVDLHYQKGTADITSLGTWDFPSRFHLILPYETAKRFYAVDNGEKGRAWDDRYDLFAKDLYKSMQNWNMDIQLQARNNQDLN